MQFTHHYRTGPAYLFTHSSDMQSRNLVIGGGFDKSRFSWWCWRRVQSTSFINQCQQSVPVSRVKLLRQALEQLLALMFDNTTELVMKRLAPDSAVQKNLANSSLSLQEDLRSCRASYDSPNSFKCLAALVTRLPSEVRIWVTQLCSVWPMHLTAVLEI